jgi:hypothetical protein
MMVKRPAFWILLVVAALGATAFGVRYFPDAFSIVALDITMDRRQALDQARAIMTRDRRGPSGFRQAASFAGDGEAQTFVELEGGGKEALARMLRDGLHVTYTWRVRHYKEGDANETTIRFTPDGRPYGFVERVKEDAPGAALGAGAARTVAEDEAGARWAIDLALYTPIEQGQERRLGGRVDHTFTYERPSPTLNDGRYRLRLVVSGDRLTEVTHFINVPEAFSRRYANMRSANEAIGIGSVVALVIVYVFCGIGVGLFVMLRQRWVLWRRAAFWGVIVGLLQALAAVNELPLLWMTYDTALPRATFLAQQAATIGATFIGFSVFLGLSFIAAETLGRKAFGHHPQLWRVWSRGPGRSTSVLGQTVGGYLLVPVFFAYEVALYLFMTRTFGWWSPSEALLHPDVLATPVPWLSAIANSLQAGFWEESLFRAVPLAGAALIGDRFGKRNLFLVIAFVAQAIIFGAGHAPYPTQPSYARLVELMIPSIGFGLLYVYCGLLPGIVLHFAFDVVWFALPIFLADAPGIWFQQAMVVVMTLVPLWIVAWRRVQAGHWTMLSPLDRNAAWSPPAAVDAPVVVAVQRHHALAPLARRTWLGVGAVSFAGAVAISVLARSDSGELEIGRQQAEDVARQALAQRGVVLDASWRVMPVPDDGRGGLHEFVSETAGEARRRQLLGVYLPAPRWSVRIASFDGDVANRAEEWQVFVTGSGEPRTIRHTLPEGRAGATLDEPAARQLAGRALEERLGLSIARGDVKEISARPAKLKARTDWTFTFVDTTLEALPQGELRVVAEIAGDEVVATGRSVYAPEEWQRRSRAAATRNTILRVLITLVFAGLLVGAGVLGVIAWSRRRYAPRLFFAGAALMLIVSVARAVNGWPAVLASVPTVAPLSVTLAGIAGIGLVGLAIIAALVGLVLGGVPPRLAGAASLSNSDALRLGVAAGVFGAAAGAAAAWLRTPVWAQVPEFSAFGTLLPAPQVMLNPVPGLLTQMAVLLAALLAVDAMTAGWTRRRTLALVTLAVIGFLAAGAPAGAGLGRWATSGLVTAIALLAVYVTLLRFDLTMVPLAVGTMAAVGAIAQGAQRPFPGALAGALIGAPVLMLVAWWWFRALRRWRDRATPHADPGVTGNHLPTQVEAERR